VSADLRRLALPREAQGLVEELGGLLVDVGPAVLAVQVVATTLVQVQVAAVAGGPVVTAGALGERDVEDGVIRPVEEDGRGSPGLYHPPKPETATVAWTSDRYPGLPLVPGSSAWLPTYRAVMAPAEVPPMAMRSGSIRYWSAWRRSQRTAACASCWASAIAWPMLPLRNR
jgi:hypothetical protein